MECGVTCPDLNNLNTLHYPSTGHKAQQRRLATEARASGQGLATPCMLIYMFSASRRPLSCLKPQRHGTCAAQVKLTCE